MADLKKLAEELSKLTVLEAAELVKTLEADWGVSAAAPVAVAAAGAGPAATEEVEEKTEFDVVLKDTGPKKIDVIKVIRQLTSLGLVEAKTMAETAGAKVLTGAGKDAGFVPGEEALLEPGLALKPGEVAADGRFRGAQDFAQGSAADDLLALKVLVNEPAALRGDQVFAQIRPLSFSQ